MAIYTQHTFGLPGQRYGSFAGKEASAEPAGPHNPGVLTQLAPYALSGGRYAFVAKGEAAEPQPEPTGLSGGRGGVNPWPGRKDRQWDKWWKKEHAKRLEKKKQSAEKKVEKLEAKLKEARTDLQYARTLEAIKLLLAELERIKTLLDKEQARLDDLEMQEVAMLWAAWDD